MNDEELLFAQLMIDREKELKKELLYLDEIEKAGIINIDNEECHISEVVDKIENRTIPENILIDFFERIIKIEQAMRPTPMFPREVEYSITRASSIDKQTYHQSIEKQLTRLEERLISEDKTIMLTGLSSQINGYKDIEYREYSILDKHGNIDMKGSLLDCLVAYKTTIPNETIYCSDNQFMRIITYCGDMENTKNNGQLVYSKQHSEPPKATQTNQNKVSSLPNCLISPNNRTNS